MDDVLAAFPAWLRKQFFFFQVHSHVPEKQQASLQSGNFWKSKASTKGESASYTPPWTCFGLEMMPYDVSFGKFLFFVYSFIVFSCLTCKWHFIFYLQVHKLNTYLFRFWKYLCLGQWNILPVSASVFISSSTVHLIPQHWTFFLHRNYLFSWHS